MEYPSFLLTLVLLGYGMLMTVIALSRRSTPPPTIVVTQEPTKSPGCGAFLALIGMVIAALVLAALLG